jgi:hypothetical protein
MIKDIVDAGGPGLVIPAVLFILTLYAARGLFGLQGRKGQHRKEFLELWDPARMDDDLWLEVTIRHQFGTYLPAHVIRTILAYPARSQGLIDVSELWPLLRYDAATQTVRWRSTRHEKLGNTRFPKVKPFLWYFLLASFAGSAVMIAYHADQNMLVRWTFSFLSVLLGGAAFVQLLKDDAVKIAAESGDEWILRINSARTSGGESCTQAKPLNSG